MHDDASMFSNFAASQSGGGAELQAKHFDFLMILFIR
jgi:hypothetical protein